jgi:hypothetical protein
MGDQPSSKPERQDPDAPPVVDNPNRRLMDAGPSRPRRINRAVLRMDSNPQPPGDSGARMEPVPASMAQGFDEPPPPAEQQPAAAAQTSEGYVRLQMRVDNGVMSVVDAREVAGPLARPSSVANGFLYEVAQGARQVGVGAIPDLGISRSYPRPPGAPGQAGHHITVESSCEFAVRVQRQSLSLQALPRTRVVLYQVMGDVPIPASGAGLLGAQFGRELQAIAHLDGIHLDRLPETVQNSLRSALR